MTFAASGEAGRPGPAPAALGTGPTGSQRAFQQTERRTEPALSVGGRPRAGRLRRGGHGEPAGRLLGPGPRWGEGGSAPRPAGTPEHRPRHGLGDPPKPRATVTGTPLGTDTGTTPTPPGRDTGSPHKDTGTPPSPPSAPLGTLALLPGQATGLSGALKSPAPSARGTAPETPPLPPGQGARGPRWGPPAAGPAPPARVPAHRGAAAPPPRAAAAAAAYSSRRPRAPPPRPGETRPPRPREDYNSQKPPRSTDRPPRRGGCREL
ncbi:basic salivary proline-rich protein 1-like [Manacus candei]|uniref:basic salivary proline-rich protein 1-like n=1 Tax=Manacus candei TaxID=415023 RepID=UPI002225BECB|nr:basic salivary proline-rich protein 1-like [Manacus candei]